MQKRIWRNKLTDPEAPATGSEGLNVAKERPRVRPNHKTAMAAAELSDEVKATLNSMSRYAKQREEKRLTFAERQILVLTFKYSV